MNERRLKDWIASYLEYTDETEPPLLFREWCAVSVIAAAMQRKCRLEWGSISFYPNLYVVLTAPAGKARKGTAMSPARKFVDRLDIPMAAEAVTREALIRTLKESEELLPMNDGSAPCIHSSLTVFSPELTVFLGYNNVQLMSDLTDWFDCADKWVYRTKTAGVDDINGVFLNLLGATTPELIRSTLPMDAIGGGLTSRMIFVYEEKKGKTVPYPFLSEETKQLETPLYYDIELVRAMKGKFVVTKKFLSLWGDWYLAQDGKSPFPSSASKAFAGYIERRPTQILKLSMIMNASRGGDMKLDDIDLVRAIDLLERTEVKMPNAFGGTGASQTAVLTYSILEALRIKGPMSIRDLLRSFMFDGTQEDMSRTLNTLLACGMIRSVNNEKGMFYEIVEDAPNSGLTKEEQKEGQNV